MQFRAYILLLLWIIFALKKQDHWISFQDISFMDKEFLAHIQCIFVLQTALSIESQFVALFSRHQVHKYFNFNSVLYTTVYDQQACDLK